MSSLHTLAFEIGTEEIPAFDLHRAAQQLEKLVPQTLDEARIPYEGVALYTTPRRLIVLVSGVADKTEALEEVMRGPSAKIAFDEEGNPTKAALGFARGKGLGVESLEKREENGVTYVFARRSVPACDVIDLLPSLLEDLITRISWPKSCRWGTRSEFFSRPVRWLLALLDAQVVPVRFAGLDAGNITWGHRFLSFGPHVVDTAAHLLTVLKDAFVLTSEKEREEVIRQGVADIEAKTGGHAQLPEKTLLEVVNLTEYPTVLMGTFDRAFLEVPEEIIVDAMLMHQRYFPLYDDDGRLKNNFIVVSNGDPVCAATIIDGNERVVRARLSDAQFFYEEDLKQPLDTFVDRLDEVVFQEALGTMRDKTNRLKQLAYHIARDAGLSDRDVACVARSAHLLKADLVTNAVIEFTSVQGIMGSYYALASGENAQVARAIADHYRPRFSGDELPFSQVGKVVAMADKLDTICGLFAVNQAPTGSSDPFALRRSAIGIVAMLEEGLPVSLTAAIDVALDIYAHAGVSFDCDEVRGAIIDFFITRTKVILRDSGSVPDAIDAVLAVGVCEPAVIIARVHALETARTNEPEVFDDLAIAYARANNLRDTALGDKVDEALMGAAETALLSAVSEVSMQVKSALDADDYIAALSVLATLRTPIDTFFVDVMVMDDDQALRENRLKLLNRFVSVFARVADFGKMARKK